MGRRVQVASKYVNTGGMKIKKAMWITLLLVLLPLASRAKVITLGPEGMTLTEALSLCVDGDVIELADGVYAEPRESFPLTISKAVTICAARGASPVISSPPLQTAVRVEADGVTLEGLDIRFRNIGIEALGDDMTLENCSITLADEAWRTSSCGMWCGGIYRMRVQNCAFTGCSISLAGPPLSDSSRGLPVLTGLFEVGEDVGFFTTHSIENNTVNGKPLFYAVSRPKVTVPEDVGQIICCDCGEVTIQNADVSGGSMGMVLVYNRSISLENCRADRCGVFGIYVAKCDGGILKYCSAENSNHGLDIRASRNITLLDCSVKDCDQGLFFSQMRDSAMVDCIATGTGQGFFMAAGSGNALVNCAAIACENGFNLQKEGLVLMDDCIAEGCTVCGVRMDATPIEFSNNTLKDNWVGVMAYGGKSVNMQGNLFEGSESCALYLRDIAFSRFTGNAFSSSVLASVQAVGTLGGSIWSENTLDLPMDMTQAKDGFSLGK